MSQKEKLLDKFKSRSVNFTWDELTRLLGYFGYQIVKRGKIAGSRRKFFHPTYGFIMLHEPHPQKILKRYQIEQIIETLNKEGLL